MQVITHGDQFDGSEGLARILEDCEIHSMVDHGAMRLYVVTLYGNQDILLIADQNNNVFSIYASESFDAESGGSIHQQARADCDG
jgi:hypothetical protein